MKILAKMRVTEHQYMKICPKEFEELETKMLCNRKIIWMKRKTYPESYNLKLGIKDIVKTVLEIIEKTTGMSQGKDIYR